MKKLAIIALCAAGHLCAQVQIGKGVQLGGAGTGTGSVTSVSVTTANGFQGTVSSPSTTPGIQINVDSTHCLPVNTGTGLDFLAGNCTYLPPFTLTTTGTSGAATFSGGVLNIPQYTGGSGSVSTVSVTTANGVSGTVANPTTTPAISLTLGAITPSSVASTGQVSGTSLVSGAPSSAALAALPSGAHGTACDESSTPGVPATGVDYIRCKTGVGLVQSVNGGAEAPIGGASGFPITLGSTPVAASSTTTALAGLALTTSSINGVTPSTTAGSGNFLNGAGGYSSPGGISVKIKYVSVEGCPQDTDLTAGGGTDATTCINALWAGASPTNPILVVQDGASLISGNGVQMPAGGGAFLQGSGGGISQVAITNCSLTSNVATFTTEPQAPLITVGQNVQLAALSTCSALNGEVVTALSSGLTSTQFKANFTHADISTGAETATGKTVYGTGFYLADGSGDAVSNGRVPSAGNCEIPNGTPPSRGAGLGISNLVINGNAPNQTDYCFLVDFDNANNVFVDNVTLYNAAHYGVHMGNVGQVKITRSSFIAAQAYVGAMVTTDGIHMTGPWNDLTISNDYCNTGDDCIALNASEGYCGPGDRTEITNSTSYSSLRMLRIYNEGAVCGNGLTPLVDTVNINNFSGSAYGNVADLGFSAIGTLNPAITNVTWANSVVKALPGALDGIEVVNNIGRLSFDDFTMEGFQGCLLCSSVGSQSIALLKLHNVSLIGNSISGSSFIAPLGDAAGGGTLTATDAIVDGLGEYNDTGGTISAGCPFCSGAVTNLYASNIDMNLFTTFADSSVTNLQGAAGPNSWARNTAGGPWTFNAYGGGAGFDFYPHSSGGSAFNRFYDVNGKTLFCMDTNNEWIQVGGVNTSNGCSDNPTAEPIFMGSGFINWNRKPGDNAPKFGSVGNWTWFHSPSGTASADCIHMQAQAFGAGGPSDVLVQCADGAVSIPGALTVGSCSGCGGGSSGISGLTSGFIPLAGSATTLTSNSPFDYGITTASTVTSTKAIAVSGLSGSVTVPLNLSNGGTVNTQFDITNTTNSTQWQFAVPGSAGFSSDAPFCFYTSGGSGKFTSCNTITGIQAMAGLVIGWAGGTNANASNPFDTGLSRDSAGVVDVGNGTAGDKSGTINAATYGAGALANGMTATTGSLGAGGTNVATQAYVDRLLGGSLSCSNLAFGAGAGSSPVCTSVLGTDGNHQVTITAGTAPSAGSTIFTLTYTASRGHTSYCVASPNGGSSGLLTGANQGVVSSESATQYTFGYGGATGALTATFSYTWNLVCP